MLFHRVYRGAFEFAASSWGPVTYGGDALQGAQVCKSVTNEYGSFS